ncbi:MAG TPA: helix-turn-helix domain-containing protein [Ktedonobacteraceae bacterium]
MARTPKVVEDRHEQIIDAALRVFAEKGFARATNRDIAREAGITTGLIYYYFKSKEDLLKAALEERSPLQVMAHIPQELLEQPPDVFLPVLITRVLDVVENSSFVEMIRVLLPEMLHGSTSVSPITLDFFQRIIGFVSHYLQIQVTRGTVRAELDLHATAQAMVSALIGMVLRRQIIRDPGVLQYSHEEIAQTLLQTFGRGIQPD